MRRLRLLVPLALVPLALLVAPGAAYAGTLDHVVDAFQAESQLWLAVALPPAQQILAALAALEIALTIVLYVAEQRDGNTLLVRSAQKFVVIAFLGVVIQQSPFFLGSILSSASALGAQLAGSSSFSPSRLVDAGAFLAAAFLRIADTRGMAFDLPGWLLATTLALLVFGSFCLSACRVTYILIEAAIQLSIGLVFLAFGASRFTASIAESYLLRLANLAIRVVLTYALLGVVFSLASRWMLTLSTAAVNDQSWELLFDVTAGSIGLGLLVISLPAALARELTSGASPFGLQQLLRS